MPRYELSLIIKCLERPELIQVIKRTSQYILEKGGIIRGFENIGQRPFPFKLSKDKKVYSEGNYFLVNFDSPTNLLLGLQEHMRRDLDIIRPRLFRKEEEVRRPCETDPCHFGELNEEVRRKLTMDLKNCVKKL